jgi:hypothetical protein
MKRVFISGPYTALSEEERQKVVELATKVAAQYMAMGYSPYVPHLIFPQIQKVRQFTYAEIMKCCINEIKDREIVAFLPGWENSKGASIEHMVACALGKEIEYVRE